MKKPGRRPATSSRWATNEAVVVLPWLPATTSDSLALDEKALQGLGHGKVLQAPVEDEFGFGVAAADGIADDAKIDVGGNVLRGKTLEQRDLQVFEQPVDRRIKTAVRSVNLIALLLEKPGQGAHAGAGDAAKKNFFHHFTPISQRSGSGDAIPYRSRPSRPAAAPGRDRAWPKGMS